MKKILFITLIALLRLNMSGQALITGYEYWFDDDYSGKITLSITPETVFNCQAIDCSNLNKGLYMLNIRFKDNAGHWSSTISRYFQKVVSQQLSEVLITGYEYWFDDDYTNRITTSITPTTVFNLQSVDCSNLGKGTYLLNIRFKDLAGNWSSTVSRYFQKVAMNSGEILITEYEYWFNDDYSEKITTSITQENPFNLETLINCNQLPIGMHVINLRFKDSFGYFSSTVSETFEKINADCETYFEGTTGDLTWKFCDGTLTISGDGYMPDFTSPYIPAPKFLNSKKGKNSKDLSPWDSIGDLIVIVIIETGVKSVGSHAFSGLANMNNVTIPGTVESIGDGSFAYTTSLPAVTIPSSTTHIGNGAFSYSTGLSELTVEQDNPNYSSQDGVLFNENQTTLIQYPSGKQDEHYVIPSSVTTIGDYSFAGSVYLRTVTIHSSVKTIGEGAFANCSNLTIIYVDDDNPDFSSEDGILFNKDKTKLIQYPAGKEGEIYILSRFVSEIESWAFSNCVYLIVIIVDEENQNFSNIEGVLMNRERTAIICYPAGREDVNYEIPEGIITVRPYAFSGNRYLRSVIIQESVLSIRDYAFWDCDLSEVTIRANIPPALGAYVFYGIEDATLYVPEGTKELYIEAGYRVYFAIIEEYTSINNQEVATFKIYPNPATSELRVESGELIIEGIEIFDMTGIKQKAESRMQNGELVIDVSSLPSGVYIIKLIENRFVNQQRFIIFR